MVPRSDEEEMRFNYLRTYLKIEINRLPTYYIQHLFFFSSSIVIQQILSERPRLLLRYQSIGFRHIVYIQSTCSRTYRCIHCPRIPHWQLNKLHYLANAVQHLFVGHIPPAHVPIKSCKIQCTGQLNQMKTHMGNHLDRSRTVGGDQTTNASPI